MKEEKERISIAIIVPATESRTRSPVTAQRLVGGRVVEPPVRSHLILITATDSSALEDTETRDIEQRHDAAHDGRGWN